jgi:hypothetical protein
VEKTNAKKIDLTPASLGSGRNCQQFFEKWDVSLFSTTK